MAVLALRVAVVLAASFGCYGPELRECTVACAVELDCAPGQVCGDDGRCASPARAGRCADPDPPDAGSADADVPPHDTPRTTTLRIKIRGRGHVIVDGDLAMTCAHTAPGDQCTFDVRAGVPHLLHAVAAAGHRFARWDDACDGEHASCWLTPSPPHASVTARFEEHDDDDDD